MVETTIGVYSVSLALNPTGTFSGTASGNTASGTITFSGLRILSAGTFNIVASSTNIVSAVSIPATVVNYVYTITLSANTTSTSINFGVNITAVLKGEDGNAFSGSCVVTLTESTSSIQGTISNTITIGSGSFYVYFTSTGTKSVVATCPASGSSPAVTQSISISISTLILKISFAPTVIIIQPTTSLSSFTATIGAYDNLGQNLETLRGPYTIALSLSPTGTFSGTTSGSTSAGILSLSSLRILSANTFTLTASSTGITSATASLTIVNYVYTISLTATPSTVSVDFSLSIAVTLKGEDTNLFSGTCVIGLTESTSSLQGTTSQSITGGTGSFSIYFTSVGTKSVVATCSASGSSPAVTQTVSVTVQSNSIKITSFTAVSYM